MANRAPVPPKATRREWIGLAVLVLPCLLYSMDLTVLNLAIPHLTTDLEPTGAQLLWIIDIYGFMVAGTLITMGTLGDRLGRRKLLMIGASAFGMTSILAAFANTAELLIAARALLGVAAATLAPSTLSLIRNMFLDDKQRALAIGIWISGFSAGGAIGPVVGGAILSYFWWGAVFLVAVPVMILILTLGPKLLPEFRDPHAGRLDLVSAAMSLATVLPIIYGMKRIAEYGFAWSSFAAIVAGGIVGIVFTHRQNTLAEPMLDLRLFRIKAFSVSLIANILCIFIAFGSFICITQYLQLVLEFGPLEAGLWMVPSGIALIVGSLLAPLIARKVHRAYVLAGGFILSAIGFAMLTQIGEFTSMGPLVVAIVLYCLGLAPIGAITSDLIVGSAPPERAGIASAMSETAAEFGGALGIAVLGSIVTIGYRAMMARTVPDSIPAESIAAASETLGGATVAAQQLPKESGSLLLDAAREAFTQSVQTTAGICAVIAVAAAIAVFLLLRGVSASPAAERAHA